MMKTRCLWPADDPLMIEYHDNEWGIPQHNDLKLFEFIVLDTFQAGMSWKTILYKREALKRSFDNFNPNIIASYQEKKINELLHDPSIIRNKMKILAVVRNANAFLKVQNEFGSFNKFIWQFTNGKTIHHCYTKQNQIPNRTALSDAMSNEMKKRGFSFVGSIICYAFMQATGMVNDHLTSCFRYDEIKANMIGKEICKRKKH